MEFKNDKMKAAMRALRDKENQFTIQHMVDSLITSQLLVPAQWDKDPVEEQGQMIFSPDTKFQLMVINDDRNNCYFPMFTSMEELKKWDTENEIQSLVMSFEQYLPFVEISKDTVRGIVVNPYSENVPFTCDYILQVNQERIKNLREHSIDAAEQFNLREPVANVEALKAQLAELGNTYTEIKSIYLLERLVKDQPSHWFVVVDMDPENPKLFQVIGETSRPFAKGKGTEFLFASTKEGRLVAEQYDPVYKEGV